MPPFRGQPTQENLTGRELADELKISLKTIGRWRREGIIPAVRLSPKTIRYDLAAVVAALKARQQGRPAADPAIPTPTV